MNTDSNQTNNVAYISVEDAYKELSTARFIDIRNPDAYKVSHIPNAYILNELFTHLTMSDKESIDTLKKSFEEHLRNMGINGDEHIITYENSLNTRFGASCRGYYILSLLGLKVSVLNGGFDAWVKAGYPVNDEIPHHERGTFVAGWNESIWVDKHDVLKNLETNEYVLLDVRDEDEWTAESSSPYGKDFAPRKGHIPGAVHINWRDFMDEKDGLVYFKSADDVKSLCNKAGVTGKDIIVYCFKGSRASNSLIALNTAGFNVKNYFGSWNEWSRDYDLAIDI